MPLAKLFGFLRKTVEFREYDFGEGPKLLLVFSQRDQKASPGMANSRFQSGSVGTSVVSHLKNRFRYSGIQRVDVRREP
jgi:hypothetical protein